MECMSSAESVWHAGVWYLYMSRFANNALLGGGGRVRVGIRE